MRFKRDVGILPSEDGPGLPLENTSWNVSQGGTGFAPPYCFPKTPLAPFPSSDEEAGDAGSGSSPASAMQLQNPPTMHGIEFELASETANKFLQSFTTRYAKPATVFCSRELENGLTDYVRTAVVQNGQSFPDDNALRTKACEILGRTAQHGTPADDKELLGKFKEMVRGMLTVDQTQQAVAAAQLPTMPEVFDMNIGDINTVTLSNDMKTDANISSSLQHANSMPLDMNGMNMNVDLNLDSVTQEDMDNLFQDMNFEFEDGSDFIKSQ